MIWYVIYKIAIDEKKYVYSIEQSLANYNALKTLGLNLGYIHLDDTVSTMPKIGDEFDPDSYSRDEKRTAAYRLEADKLFMAWKGKEEDNDAGKQAEKDAWNAKRTEIKAKYPES